MTGDPCSSSTNKLSLSCGVLCFPESRSRELYPFHDYLVLVSIVSTMSSTTTRGLLKSCRPESSKCLYSDRPS